MSEDRIMGKLYQRFPVTIQRGSGARVWDTDGREYIDCMGGYGVALVGHANPRVVRAIKEQAEQIITVHSSLYSKTRERFLETLAGLAPDGLSQIHMSNSGAEAIEAAIKFARKFTGKKGMIAMRGSYHGKSMGALSLTFNPRYRKAFQPLVDRVDFTPFGNAGALRDAITEETGFVIVEPVQGESGIHVAPPGFLREVREICDERGILLVSDEIQSGLGRTGRMWAADNWDVTPDIMCLAKGIAGGVPMGATLARPEILDSMSRGEHSSTFGGNPLSCAAGTAALQCLVQDGLVQNARTVGEVFIRGLNRLRERHPVVREVRGMGLMIGMELRFEVRDIIMEGIKRNILLLYSGRNILRFLPPLVITEQDITKVLGILDVLLSEEEERRGVNRRD